MFVVAVPDHGEPPLTPSNPWFCSHALPRRFQMGYIEKRSGGYRAGYRDPLGLSSISPSTQACAGAS